MRKFIFSCLILISLFGYGQEWAPTGAEWYYDLTWAFSGSINYHRVYCDSVISVKGKDCKRINIDYCACNNHFCHDLLTYEQNDTIFFYNPDVDTFQVLYDFSATQDSEWEIYTKDFDDKIDTVTVHVDSVTTVTINEMELTKLYVSYFYHYGTYYPSVMHSVIIEKLGDLYLIINIIDKYAGACDLDYIHSLRCYEDTEIGYYSTGLRDSCTYEYFWTSIDSRERDPSIEVFPNPAGSYLTIGANGHSDIRYEIFDINGRLIKIGNNCSVDMTDVVNGIYIIKIQVDNTVVSRKIVKHSL